MGTKFALFTLTPVTTALLLAYVESKPTIQKSTNFAMNLTHKWINNTPPPLLKT